MTREKEGYQKTNSREENIKGRKSTGQIEMLLFVKLRKSSIRDDERRK